MCAEPNLGQYTLEPNDAFDYSAVWFEFGLSAVQITAKFKAFLKGSCQAFHSSCGKVWDST